MRSPVLVELVEVIVSSDTSGLELTHGGECCQGMLRALDVSSDMVRRTSNELGLVGQPVDVDSILAFTIFLVLLHDNVCRTQPSDFHQAGLTCISPEPNLLSKVVLGVEALVFCPECPSESLVGVGLDHGLLSSTAAGQGQFEVFVAAKLWTGLKVSERRLPAN